MDQQNTQKALAIMKALALTENGGKLDLNNSKAGQSGEMKSIFQFTPGTWKMYSKEILGKDNVPLDKNSEAVVVSGKISKWLDEGLKPQEIASIWNSGKPDAYLQDHKGTNKYGVQYNTPGYVKKFDQHLQETEKSLAGNGDMGQGPINQGFVKPANNPTQVATQPQSQKSPTLPDLMKTNQMKQVKQI